MFLVTHLRPSYGKEINYKCRGVCYSFGSYSSLSVFYIKIQNYHNWKTTGPWTPTLFMIWHYKFLFQRHFTCGFNICFSFNKRPDSKKEELMSSLWMPSRTWRYFTRPWNNISSIVLSQPIRWMHLQIIKSFCVFFRRLMKPKEKMLW